MGEREGEAGVLQDGDKECTEALGPAVSEGRGVRDRVRVAREVP